jgi:hypothetical protein
MMTENSEIVEIEGKATDSNSSQVATEKMPLLPRSAWNSQLGYLKALLKAKQALDKSQRVN